MVKIRGKFRRALGKSRKRRAVAAIGKYRKRMRVTKNRTNVPIGKGFPQKMTMTHKYEEVVDITSTTGAQQIHRLLANSMYDPNNTGVGHQPLFFDQMAALYNHYHVIGAKLTCTFIPKASAGIAMGVGVVINDDASPAYTSISNLGEQSRGQTRVIAPSSNTPVKIVSKYSAKKMYGGSILGNVNLQGTASANPTELAYWDVVAQAYASGTSAVTVRIQIEYIAVWSEVKDVAES